MKLQNGFTMIEMTIVLIMIGLLTAALAPLLMNQHTNTMEERERQALAKAKEEIISYATANGGIPNPLNESPALSNPCTNIQINPLLAAPTTGVGMMPPPSSLMSICAKAVSSFDVNNWGAFGSINNVTANPLQTFQMDVSDALLSYTNNRVNSAAPSYTGGNPVVFCQAVQQQLRGGYCSDNTSLTPALCTSATTRWVPGGYCSNLASETPAICTAAAATWISGGYCYNSATNTLIASIFPAVPLTPLTCTGAGGTWYAAPQVCQDTTGNHLTVATKCTSYSPAAFVLYSTGNDRIPNQGNDQGVTKLGTNPIGSSRIYESDTRGINNAYDAAGDHYDDQVMSYPLSSLANDCQTKMNVSPEVMQCSPGQKALVVTNSSGVANLWFKTANNIYGPNQTCLSVPQNTSTTVSICQDRAAVVNVYNNNLCTILTVTSPALSTVVLPGNPNYINGKINANITGATGNVITLN